MKIDEKIKYTIENYNRLSISQIAKNLQTNRYVISAIIRTYEIMRDEKIATNTTPPRAPNTAPPTPPQAPHNVKRLKREMLKREMLKREIRLWWWWVILAFATGAMIFWVYFVVTKYIL